MEKQTVNLMVMKLPSSLIISVADLAHAKAGDVLCYAGHVAIYDGNGMIVEAKNETAGITHDRSADCRPILAIRRFTTD